MPAPTDRLPRVRDNAVLQGFAALLALLLSLFLPHDAMAQLAQQSGERVEATGARPDMSFYAGDWGATGPVVERRRLCGGQVAIETTA